MWCEDKTLIHRNSIWNYIAWYRRCCWCLCIGSKWIGLGLFQCEVRMWVFLFFRRLDNGSALVTCDDGCHIPIHPELSLSRWENGCCRLFKRIALGAVNTTRQDDGRGEATSFDSTNNPTKTLCIGPRQRPENKLLGFATSHSWWCRLGLPRVVLYNTTIYIGKDISKYQKIYVYVYCSHEATNIQK